MRAFHPSIPPLPREARQPVSRIVTPEAKNRPRGEICRRSGIGTSSKQKDERRDFCWKIEKSPRVFRELVYPYSFEAVQRARYESFNPLRSSNPPQPLARLSTTVPIHSPIPTHGHVSYYSLQSGLRKNFNPHFTPKISINPPPANQASRAREFASSRRSFSPPFPFRFPPAEAQCREAVE